MKQEELVRYIKLTINLLWLFPIIPCLLYVDVWLLPKQISVDSFDQYYIQKIYNKRNAELMRNYRIVTKKGFEFTLSSITEETILIIESSPIFGIITSIKSDKKDYSSYLVSGLVGLNWIFTNLVLLSSILSIAYLKLKKSISENAFYNIILVNIFIAFFYIYFWGFNN